MTEGAVWAAALSRQGTKATTVWDPPGHRKLQLVPSTPSATKRAEAELRTIRIEIQREKVRAVAPYPFYGHPMGFKDAKDKSCALQISSDGVFKYSVVPESVDGSLPTSRRIITFEGVFGPALERPTKHDEEWSAADKPEDDMSVASIEGRALVCYVMGDRRFDGKIRLFSAERGDFRFTITVRPFFQPTAATAEATVQPRFTHGEFGRRIRTLQYVGVPGTYTEELEGNGAHLAGGGVIRRCESPSGSLTRLRAKATFRSPLVWNPMTPSVTPPQGCRPLRTAGMLSSSASAPVLMT